jgi:hypothetical protein
MHHRLASAWERAGLWRGQAAAALLGAALLGGQAPASANHPVLVEGERDFDGDGLLGAAEDVDNATDRVFGTIGAALGAANGGANQNGRVTIVTSGRFPEVVLITAANGNVSLEAAPGVDADIDAVLAGNAGNVQRQGMPGIIVNAPADRIVTLANLMSRNWTIGLVAMGGSRVVVDRCRFENNVQWGIRVLDNARATITNSRVTASGFRVAAGVDNTPAPGTGIAFEGNSAGQVSFTTVAGSAGGGIVTATAARNAVSLLQVAVFDNNPNFGGR